jgi:hypothetical protein
MSGDDKIDSDEWIDRPQGILTTTEREVLIGGEQFEPRGREARSRIRRRLGDALLDYIIIDRQLPEKDLVQAFGSDRDDGRRPYDSQEWHFVDGLKAQVKFVYRAAKAAGPLDPESIIEDAVAEAEGTRIQQLLERFEAEPESLTFGEAKALVDAGEISREDYRRLMSDVLRPPIGRVGEEDAGEEQTLAEFLDEAAEQREEEFLDDLDGEE